MIIFVDTSAFYALLDRDDINHQKARKIWDNLITTENILITNNYVLLETLAIIQHRLGLEAVRGLHDNILPLINIEWITESIHKSGLSALLAASKKKLSLTDCVSFETIRNLGITTVFVFDPHFSEQGFKCIP